jgi:hypothetical protein
MYRESLRPPQISIVSPKSVRDLYNDASSADRNESIDSDDTGQITSSSLPDKEEGACSSVRSQFPSSRRSMNSIKKSLESYHENMFGFFGLSLQPSIFDDDEIIGSESVPPAPAPTKADEMAKIKQRARQRLQTDMESVGHDHSHLNQPLLTIHRLTSYPTRQ